MPPCPVVSLPSPSQNPRKRTTSFLEPLPRKTSRTMLSRTESFLCLSDLNDESQYEGGSFLHMTPTPTRPPTPMPSRLAPLSRTRPYYREQQQTTKLGRKRAMFTIRHPLRPPEHPSSNVAPVWRRIHSRSPQSTTFVQHRHLLRRGNCYPLGQLFHAQNQSRICTARHSREGCAARLKESKFCEWVRVLRSRSCLRPGNWSGSFPHMKMTM